jgi:hypothetical protein
MSGSTPLQKLLQTAVDANVRYYTMLGQLAGTFADSLLTSTDNLLPAFRIERDTAPQPRESHEASATPPQAGALVVSPPPSSAPALLLQGAAGSRAIGVFLIENKLQKTITTRVEFAPLVDPAGRKLKSTLRFQPAKVTLGPGQQVLAKVTAHINRALTAGVRYEGAIRIPGMAGAQVPIVVRRTGAASVPLAAETRASRRRHKGRALPDSTPRGRRPRRRNT